MNEDLVKSILAELKKRGYRSSINRESIITVLNKAEKPLTVSDIYERVDRASSKKDAQEIDQSTVYRIIESLTKEGFVKVINLLEGNNRYELERGDHHHHLVCTECEDITPIHMGSHLKETEHDIEKSTGYDITSHSLEFFGICPNCKVNP
jgi:Fe2+ or Zn2+ uptake regulation protein